MAHEQKYHSLVKPVFMHNAAFKNGVALEQLSHSNTHVALPAVPAHCLLHHWDTTKVALHPRPRMPRPPPCTQWLMLRGALLMPTSIPRTLKICCSCRHTLSLSYAVSTKPHLGAAWTERGRRRIGGAQAQEPGHHASRYRAWQYVLPLEAVVCHAVASALQLAHHLPPQEMPQLKRSV